MKYYFIVTAVFLLFLPSFAFAATKTFRQVSHSSIYCEDADWETCRTAADGAIRYDQNSYFVDGIFTGTVYYIDRGYVSFDTSTLDDDDVINSAVLKIYDNGKRGGGSDYITVTEMVSILNLQQTYLFDLCGTSSISNVIDYGDWTTGNNQNTFNIDTDFIKKDDYSTFCLKAEKDLDDITPTDTSNRFLWYVNDTTYRAELILTFTPPPVDLTSCTPPANDDISIITGCKNIYASTTSGSTITSVETSSYYSPAILLLYIFIIILLVAIVIAVWILRHDLH